MYKPEKRPHRRNEESPRTLWTRTQEHILVDVLFDHRHERDDYGVFPKEIWREAVRRVNGITPESQLKKTLETTRAKWTSLAADFRAVCEIKKAFIWDDDKGAGLISAVEWSKWAQGRRSRVHKFRTRGMSRDVFCKIQQLVVRGETGFADPSGTLSAEPTLIDSLSLESQLSVLGGPRSSSALGGGGGGGVGPPHASASLYTGTPFDAVASLGGGQNEAGSSGRSVVAPPAFSHSFGHHGEGPAFEEGPGGQLSDPVLSSYLALAPATSPAPTSYFSRDIDVIDSAPPRQRALTPPELRTSLSLFESASDSLYLDTSFVTAAGTTFVGSSSVSHLSGSSLFHPQQHPPPPPPPPSKDLTSTTAPAADVVATPLRPPRRSVSLGQFYTPLKTTPHVSSSERGSPPENVSDESESTPHTSPDVSLRRPSGPEPPGLPAVAAIRLLQSDLACTALSDAEQMAIIEFLTVSECHALVYAEISSQALRERWIRFQLKNPKGAGSYL